MRKRWLLAAAGLVLAGVGVWATLGQDDSGLAAAAPKAAPPLSFAAAEVVRPTLAPIAEWIVFSGPLVAPATAIVRARAGGTLTRMTVAEGDRVHAGQLLGVIDVGQAATRVAERLAGVAEARAAMDQVDRSHADNTRLAAQQFISSAALARSGTELASARAGVDAAEAALATARVGLRDTTLIAPIAGIVARRQVLPGEKVSAEQELLTIVDLATLELAGSVGTHEVSKLAPGMAAQVQVEGLAQPVAGRIARIAPAAAPGTRAIGVTIELANPDERMRAGQYAQATVEIGDAAPRLTLPASAVGQDAGQGFVWVIESGKLARRAVTLGRRDEAGGRVEVLSGIGPGATVLADRFENLREGSRAVVVTPAQLAAASASVNP